jgi:hypothetical protein
MRFLAKPMDEVNAISNLISGDIDVRRAECALPRAAE